MHIIQLRGPWERETTPDRTERFDWEREALPADETVALLRRFGRPTGIEPGDAVRLIVEGFADLQLTLNDQSIPSGGDVAAVLLPRNSLRLVGRRESESPQVRLEITPTS